MNFLDKTPYPGQKPRVAKRPHPTFFFTGQRANYFSSTGKNPYRDFFVKNQSLPAQGNFPYRDFKFPIGILTSKNQSPHTGEFSPQGFFPEKQKQSPQHREFSL